MRSILIFVFFVVVSAQSLFAGLNQRTFTAGNATIVQFEDKSLAHFSYAIIAGNDMVIVDPARDGSPYLEFATTNGLTIKGVIETHPHADFVSSHKEISEKTGAKVFISALAGVSYQHTPFDEGDVIELEDGVVLKAIHTPGHSPDGISIILLQDGLEVAVFTGDTMFIGDVGRPDLREKVGNIQQQRDSLARMMYRSTREKLMVLPDDVKVFPSHGSGSLCGKALGDAYVSTIGQEKIQNYALQEMTEDQFVKLLLQDQPFIPKYFGYDVELNRKGAPDLETSLTEVEILKDNTSLPSDVLIVDVRPSEAFRGSHIQGAINIPDSGKLETWLGSVIGPEERFYLVAGSMDKLALALQKLSKIGYELLVDGAFVYNLQNGDKGLAFDKAAFEQERSAYTVIDVRNTSEVKSKKIFSNSIVIPLPELRDRLNEIPADKPVVVHCASGYRSAIAASILQEFLKQQKVIDMGEAVKQY
jgi:hydroxyacylglutathione hydrolase